MKLSILIPTFNNANILHETLDSIISQAIPDMEIIISDNASTDHTEEVVQKYATRYPFISYFKNEENLGFDRNFVLAAERAHGEFIWFIGDDKIAPGGIDKILKIIGAFPAIGQLFVNFSMYSPDFSLCEVDRGVKINEDLLCEDPENYIHIVGTGIGLTPAIVFNRELWLKVDKSPLFHTGWMPFGTALYSLPGHCAYIIADPYAMYRNANAHWHKNGSFYRMLLSLSKILLLAEKYNVSSTIVEELMNGIAKGLPMSIIGAKKNGLTATQSLLKESISLYGKYYSFWLMSLPLLLIPRICYYFSYRIYRCFKCR